MFSPFWIKLDFNIRDFIHSFALECICIGMYLEYYSIKRFFLSFGENFVIFLLLALFVSFGGGETHFLHLKLVFLR
ncbi:hypothetical protein HPSJM_04550 [Helicobacter pylori SJM180]|nr:hypothetical protein HPSJM_04550 [Helicobacter pylori SJM180]